MQVKTCCGTGLGKVFEPISTHVLEGNVVLQCCKCDKLLWDQRVVFLWRSPDLYIPKPWCIPLPPDVDLEEDDEEHLDDLPYELVQERAQG